MSTEKLITNDCINSGSGEQMKPAQEAGRAEGEGVRQTAATWVALARQENTIKKRTNLSTLGVAILGRERAQSHLQ